MQNEGYAHGQKKVEKKRYKPEFESHEHEGLDGFGVVVGVLSVKLGI